MKNETAKITVTPYLADMVNHAMRNETAKIKVTPYMVDTINHATKSKVAKIMVTPYMTGNAMNNEMVKIIDSVYLACGNVMEKRSG